MNRGVLLMAYMCLFACGTLLEITIKIDDLHMAGCYLASFICS